MKGNSIGAAFIESDSDQVVLIDIRWTEKGTQLLTEKGVPFLTILLCWGVFEDQTLKGTALRWGYTLK